jgi:hypothetical protein
MGLTGGLKPSPATAPWVRQHCAQLLPCLPGCEDNLATLAGQLALNIERG